MQLKISKYKIIAVLAGILMGSNSLSAQEAKILSNVYSSLPEITECSDKMEILSFIEKNYSKLSMETINNLMMIADNNSLNQHDQNQISNSTENSNESCKIDEGLKRGIMVFLD
ncbi:hypothetical protein QEJ31_01950 [Pigmentibacter sp. JX0631]|uniref:hypothetical protein n=1 Tax=Pigmentibacter sp. JX0631 TaxID=2976982 RepID=UPI002469395F|nr:hypothetical protein [Pigmentibacter sp. JX0631]WGL60366.1 hypothetical protein QEJ31_01950 [Pigmentibacter sp. JX0631]